MTDVGLVAVWSLCRTTPQFSGGALTFVTWHFIHDRLLQLLVRRLAHAQENPSRCRQVGWLTQNVSPREPPSNGAEDRNSDKNDNRRKSLRQTITNELRFFTVGRFGRVDRHATQLFAQLRSKRMVIDSD